MTEDGKRAGLFWWFKDTKTPLAASSGALVSAGFSAPFPPNLPHLTISVQNPSDDASRNLGNDQPRGQ